MDNTLDYQKVLRQFPWIISKGENCVISPDSDGLLSALFMSHHLGWKVKGFYDGKVLLIEEGTDPTSVVYLDIEIYRESVRSVGQHMVMPNKNETPENWGNFKNCISANNLRVFDAKNDFQNKYPFGTIHLLIAIVGSSMKLEKNPGVVAPLLYADGTFKNIFGYPENSLSWFDFLRATENDILNDVFFSQRASLVDRMNVMRELFHKIKAIGGTRGGEKVKISDRGGGKASHILNDEKNVYIEKEEVGKSERILRMFSELAGWEYDGQSWCWDNFTCVQFSKGILDGTTSFKKRNELLEKNPLSFAITATDRMEYTISQNGVFD